MEQGIMYAKNYMEYKAELDGELRRTTEAFVKIGYLLKIARDTDILKESGYENVNEFAKAEYNIDKTQVSRFIHINDRFSEGGYSDRLEEKYRGFGHAKLTIMLQLPDEINEEITPEYSKAEIQTIKDEVDSEKKITDIEVALEETKGEQQLSDSNLQRVIRQMGEDDPELYKRLQEGIVAAGMELKAIQEILSPAGEKIYSVRLRGIGRMMLSLKDTEKEVALINVRTNEKETFLWEDVLSHIKDIINLEVPAEKAWEMTYGMDFPKNEEIAPVQLQNEEKKPVPKKEIKVVKAKTEQKTTKKKEEPAADVGKGATGASAASWQEEEQVQGQMGMEHFPEYLPDNMNITIEGNEAAGTEDNDAWEAAREQEYSSGKERAMRKVKNHNLKLLVDFADDVSTGEKPFEVRENDRDYRAGDIVRYMTIDRERKHVKHKVEDKVYRITFVLGGWGLTDGHVAFGQKEISETHFDNTVKGEKAMDGTISNMLEIRENICDNYCKYRDTADEENLCDITRNGGACPIDKLC